MGFILWKVLFLALLESRVIHIFTAHGQMCHLCFLSALWWQNLPFSMLWLVGSSRNFSFWYGVEFEEALISFLQWGSKLGQREGGHHCGVPAPTMSHGIERAHKSLMEEENHCWQSCSKCMTGLSFCFSCCVKTIHNTVSDTSVSHQPRMYFCISFLHLAVPQSLSFSWICSWVLVLPGKKHWPIYSLPSLIWPEGCGHRHLYLCWIWLRWT